MSIALAAGCLCAAALGPGQAPPGSDGPVEYEVFYHHAVKNTLRRPLDGVRVYLTVPPSGAEQEILDWKVETGGTPLRHTSRTDAFGNNLRRVDLPRLESGEEIEVGFSCRARLRPPPRVVLDPKRLPAGEETPPEILERFTADDPIFGLATPAIREAAAKITREHEESVARAIAAHDLVASRLAYRSEDGWDPAPVVLERGSGSCSEFSYVFAALCRASGLPTRFVGASIFQLKSEAPFDDRGGHRWVEVHFPGQGWVAFDPTLDRGRPAKRDFVGTRHPRVLVLTRIGSRSRQLGLAYFSSNSHTGETTRRRWFTWSQGTEAELARALALLEEPGTADEGRTALRALADRFAGTRAGREARERLE